MKFTRHIGIDYSGAQTPESRLEGLQVSEARNGETPERIGTPGSISCGSSGAVQNATPRGRGAIRPAGPARMASRPADGTVGDLQGSPSDYAPAIIRSRARPFPPRGPPPGRASALRQPIRAPDPSPPREGMDRPGARWARAPNAPSYPSDYNVALQLAWEYLEDEESPKGKRAKTKS